jgi:hypothetical protein
MFLTVATLGSVMSDPNSALSEALILYLVQRMVLVQIIMSQVVRCIDLCSDNHVKQFDSY